MGTRARRHATGNATAVQDHDLLAPASQLVGGRYNARLIWTKLAPAEQERIRKIVVIGSPGVVKGDFPGNAEVLIKADPPEGHMAGPRVCLNRWMPNAVQHNRPLGPLAGAPRRPLLMRPQ
jgi:hypothetical protein